MFENVISDLEKTGVWGGWISHVVNHSNPNEYFHIDMTGVEKTQEILLNITCVKNNKMVSVNSYSIKALDIWKTGTKAFEDKPIEQALKNGLEKGEFSTDVATGKTTFDVYSTLPGTEGLKAHHQMLEHPNKYFNEVLIRGDIERSGFKSTGRIGTKGKRTGSSNSLL